MKKIKIFMAAAMLAGTAGLAVTGCGTASHPASTGAASPAVSVTRLSDHQVCVDISSEIKPTGEWPSTVIMNTLASDVDPNGNPAAGDASMASDLKQGTEQMITDDCSVQGVTLPLMAP